MRVNYFQLLNFLNARGWQIRPTEYSDKVNLFTNVRFPDRQLWLPKSDKAPDYIDSVELVFSKISQLENRPSYELISEAERFNVESIPEFFDALSLRVLNSDYQNESIPLRLAVTTISEAEVLLMASNCQALNPQSSYRRIQNKYSHSLIDNAVFNHTRKGSFILNISCTHLNSGEQLPLIDDAQSWTATRKTFVALSRSLTTLHNVIIENRVDEFTKDVLASIHPPISANVCEAMGNLMLSSLDPIEFSFNWSPMFILPDDVDKNRMVNFDHSSAYKFYDISRGLLPDEESISGEFFGTVEALRGDLNSGEREGWIELLIYRPDIDVSIRASAYLNSLDYKLADEAHIAGAQKLRIIGTLEPRPRVWSFSEINHISLVNI